MADGLEFAFLGFVHVGEGEVKIVEGFEDSSGDDKTSEPFIIGGDDVPRRVFCGGLLDHFFVSFLVVVPVAALLDVGHGEFPIFFGVFEAFEEALFLFILGNVKKEFADDDPVPGEIALESVDVLIAFVPDVLAD